MIGLWGQRGVEATLLKASSVGYQRIRGLRRPASGFRLPAFASDGNVRGAGFCIQCAEGFGRLRAVLRQPRFFNSDAALSNDR